MLSSCHEKKSCTNRDLELDDYAAFKTRAYSVNSHAIRRNINKLIDNDNDSMSADYRTKSYYINRKPFLWITRHGVDSRADTLVAYIDYVYNMGFSPHKFRAEIIRRDLQRLRALDFDESGDNDANSVLARLEYNLTKSFMRYVSGQRFGFVNPKYVFNRLDTLESDSTHTSYRDLFDIKTELPRSAFYQSAFRKIYNDSVGEFLHEVQPQRRLYYRFLSMLNDKGLDKAHRDRIICNLERCRWRLDDYPEAHNKYVFINIPSFELLAKDGDSTLLMRMGCGAFQTKTPLLTSRITRMDINPQWILPRSIIKKDVIHHLYDRRYFESHHFFVRERKTGKRVNIGRVTRGMIESKDYLVIQEGGEGNSLGRVIFRFDNGFSIFLHDTSSKEVFSRDVRGVSHGCVRVQKPFDLAVFMLDEKDEEIIGKIKYSMEAHIGSTDKEDGEDEPVEKPDPSMLINSLAVKPQIPLFISYYTIYPTSDGKMNEYADVYGYDKVIRGCLLNYQ